MPPARAAPPDDHPPRGSGRRARRRRRRHRLSCLPAALRAALRGLAEVVPAPPASTLPGPPPAPHRRGASGRTAGRSRPRPPHAGCGRRGTPRMGCRTRASRMRAGTRIGSRASRWDQTASRRAGRRRPGLRLRGRSSRERPSGTANRSSRPRAPRGATPTPGDARPPAWRTPARPTACGFATRASPAPKNAARTIVTTAVRMMPTCDPPPAPAGRHEQLPSPSRVVHHTVAAQHTAPFPAGRPRQASCDLPGRPRRPCFRACKAIKYRTLPRPPCARAQPAATLGFAPVGAHPATSRKSSRSNAPVIIVMNPNAPQAAIDRVVGEIERMGSQAHLSRGDVPHRHRGHRRGGPGRPDPPPVPGRRREGRPDHEALQARQPRVPRGRQRHRGRRRERARRCSSAAATRAASPGRARSRTSRCSARSPATSRTAARRSSAAARSSRAPRPTPSRATARRR